MNTRYKSMTATNASSSTRQRSTSQADEPQQGRQPRHRDRDQQETCQSVNRVIAPVNLIEDVDASGQTLRVRVAVHRDEDMATNEPTATSTSDNDEEEMDETALAGQLFNQLMKAAKQTKNSPAKNSYRDAFDSVKDFTNSVNVNDRIKYSGSAI